MWFYWYHVFFLSFFWVVNSIIASGRGFFLFPSMVLPALSSLFLLIFPLQKFCRFDMGWLYFFGLGLFQAKALSGRFQGSYFQAWIDFINAFMNFVNKFLVEKKTRGRVKALGLVSASVKTLLLSTLDFLVGLWTPTSLSCFLVKLVRRLT